ncbi:hypothetical protein D9M72_426520 [compost metagenome]
MVEVAEEPCGKFLILEVVERDAGFVCGPPEIQDLLGHGAGGGGLPQCGVLVDQSGGGGERLQVGNAFQDPFAPSAFRVCTEVGVFGVERFLAAGAGTGDPDLREQCVVLAEAQEHRGQNPADGSLGEAVVTPADPRGRGAFGAQRVRVLGLPLGLELPIFFQPGAQVVFDPEHQLLQLGSEFLANGHAVAPSTAAGMRSVWASIQAVSTRRYWFGEV